MLSAGGRAMKWPGLANPKRPGPPRDVVSAEEAGRRISIQLQRKETNAGGGCSSLTAVRPFGFAGAAGAARSRLANHEPWQPTCTAGL